MLKQILKWFFIAAILPMSQAWGELKMPQVDLSLSVYPKEIAFGDTCYVMVTAKNHSDVAVCGEVPMFLFSYDPCMVQFDLTRAGETWHGSFECRIHLVGQPDSIPYYTTPSGEEKVFLALSLQFPPLENLYQDAFWKEVLKEMKDNPKGLDFEFGIDFPSPGFPSRDRLTDKVTIKLRNDKEMAMIKQWYKDTPKEFFPVINKGKYLRKVPPKGIWQESGKKILGVSPWKFINMGNRFPSDPNAPETWQGWKELEESITPSTMRDEIRLTRILIQYCDTKDAKILEELKTWFAEMNETQRTCMAKTIRRLASNSNCYGNDSLLAPFRDLYQTILEYDIAAKSEREVEWMKQLKLLE